MKSKTKKLSIADIIFNAVIITFLLFFSICILFLLLWGLNTSLKSKFDFSPTFNGNILGLPNKAESAKEILLGNYFKVFEKFYVDKETIFITFGSIQVEHSTHAGMLDMLINTVVYVVIGAFLPTICCFTTAYLCAKYKFKFSTVVYVFAVFMMSVPTFGTQPAMIGLLRDIGIYDTYFVHIFQKLNYGGMYFFVFFAYFETLPDSYTEAAEIDGASEFRIFVDIIVPLGVKFIATVGLIHGVQFWNDYQSPLLYTPTLPTLSYGVYFLVNGPGNREIKNVPTIIACCMLLAIPTLALFIAFRDKFMGNLTMGGLK